MENDWTVMSDHPGRAASVDLHEGRKSKPHVDDKLDWRRGGHPSLNYGDFPVGNHDAPEKNRNL
jgi:hypothetical protein